MDSEPRYISSYCELAEYVHRDFSFQPFMDAALIILRMGGDRGDEVLSRTNPYRGSSSQFGDITFGSKNLLTLVAEAALLAQTTSYYQKWQVHRRARPRAWVVGSRSTSPAANPTTCSPRSWNVDGLARVELAYGSAGPLASPKAPSHSPLPYPAAHSPVQCAKRLCARLCAKALFDDGLVIPAPVEATGSRNAARGYEHGEPPTLGELAESDKLAANIAFARDAAGVIFAPTAPRG